MSTLKRLKMVDSWFTRISQALARDKISTADNKDELRYAVRKINQFFYAEKPNADVVDKHADVIVDLLLSTTNGPDDFEFIAQIFNIIREILDCDKKTSRPLVKSLIKNDVCSFLLNTLRVVAEDRGLGQDISLQIHQILAAIGHHDKRLALKARLFKTVGSTISLLRIYSYNAKVCPVLLTLLKIYAKNAITAAAICRAAGLQPLLRLALTLDRRHAKLQRLSITVVRHLTQTKKLAARATTTTIVRDILAVVFLMDKSQGQNRARTVKIKEGLLKVLLNIVKSKAGRVQFLEANGFYLLYELALNVLPSDYSCTFVDLSCQVLLHCCPKQQLPIDSIFSPVRFNLPPGYDYIVSNELLSADPQIVKDLDELREKCKSVIPTNERVSTADQRLRPKSSIGSAIARSSSATKCVTTASIRPKSSKGTKLDKKKTEQKTVTKKRSVTNGTKYRQVPGLNGNNLDDPEDTGIRIVEDEELDDEDSSKSDDNDEEEDDEEDETSNKENVLDSSVPLPNDEQQTRDSVDLSRAYEQFFDEMIDPVYLLRSKMAQRILDPSTESLLSRLFRNILPSSLTLLCTQSAFSYWRMPLDLHFQTYSILAKSTKSAYRFTKLAYPDAFNAVSHARLEPMQKSDERNNRSTLLGDIRRIIYPTSIFNRTVYDFDTVVDHSVVTALDNEDEQRCQMRSNLDHLRFDSQFECGNLRKAVQITEEEYDLILRPDINTFRYHQWFYFEVSNMRHDITYRFNIINFEKANSQFNSGMQPVMFSVCDALNGKPCWRRIGEKVSYYKNTYGKKKKVYYTLTFNIRFTYDNDVCYIAYHYPYTYTTLMTDIVNWSNTYDRSSIYFRQQVLCKTLSENDCPLLTITSFYNQNDVYHSEKQTIPMHERTYVMLTARVHPGESNASWIMKGIIDYLLSDEPTARLLRDQYIFKIVPMLNPDGVINGCQRCSLATKDLNRQWSAPNSVLFPTIYHTKGLLAYLSMCSSRPITLFCDFHGHSRQKNFFFYGNDPRLHFLGPAIGRSTITKMFPKLFTGVPGFALQSCLFTMRKQKEGCARMVVWEEFKIDFAYTMEATYNGFDAGLYKGLQIQISTLQMIGHDFCQVLTRLGEREYKTPEAIIPMEDLFVTSENRSQEKRATNGDEKRRSSSAASSSSSSSSSSLLSLTDGDVH
ncbi:unnamed protein product [Rotaria socialis]|uniref:Peptidase M14 domain-containing protein n=1 Tax=Rotaria socialis TaxID=392032 RepID=A0A817Q850_9BILA|nr:unnamed protein product [Rotaria socialis]CAF3193560.1 unnamed protein product [Rotaria socialis]CAF3440304.1 unnamed protein product [Rotaria socialis]CAF3709538.1 unnamed protein product [Rotaria socialis]CAF4244038.1 unnamed protein product [Rotaria socialis]